VSAGLVGTGSGVDFPDGADSGTDTGTASDPGAGAGAGAAAGAGSGMDDETVAVGSGVGSGAAIGGLDSFDGPLGSGIDSAASRAGDSATGLGMTCSGPAASASSLRDSVDDLEGVPGLANPRVFRLTMLPMRDRRDFEEGDPWSSLDMMNN
jgi:hypothetical protein